jgi:hypothetical protein
MQSGRTAVEQKPKAPAVRDYSRGPLITHGNKGGHLEAGAGEAPDICDFELRPLRRLWKTAQV